MMTSPQSTNMSWSHSKLGVFESCKFRFKLQYVDRIPEPERPLPPGKTEHANDRGSRIHQHAEDYVSGKVEHQIPEMAEFAPEFEHLRHLYTKGMVSLEGEWAVNRDWEPTNWQTGWHRSKVDSMVIPEPTSAIVIDYKSGRKFGNEVKHAEQTQLYALNAVLRYPKLEVVHTELWYLDAKELTSATFTRSQVLRFKPNFDRRGRAVTDATDFPPNGNLWSCRWCRYGNREGMSGHCNAGVWK